MGVRGQGVRGQDVRGIQADIRVANEPVEGCCFLRVVSTSIFISTSKIYLHFLCVHIVHVLCTALFTRKMQIKTRSHTHQNGQDLRLTVSSVVKDEKQLESPHPAGGKVQCYNHLRKVGVSDKVKQICTTMWSSNSTCRFTPKKNAYKHTRTRKITGEWLPAALFMIAPNQK